MKRLVILGASGMVGSHALRYALEHPNVERVTSVGRRRLGIAHPKLTEILYPDFTDCSALADPLSGHDAVVYCLGAYTGAVTESELRRVTVNYTIELARVLHNNSGDAAFSFLSGSGADTSERSRLAFARYKGAAENVLFASGFPRVYIIRPAYIYPVEPRHEPTFSYRILRRVYPALRVLFPNLVIRSDDLARAMVDLSVKETEEHESLILENRDLRAFVNSSQQGRTARPRRS